MTSEYLIQQAMGVTFESVIRTLSTHWTSSLQQTRIFNTIISRDPDVVAAVQQRQLGVTSASYKAVYMDAAQPRGVYRRIVDAFNTLNIRELLPHLALFPLFGYSAVQVVLDPETSLLPIELLPIPHTAVDYRQGEPYVFLLDKQQWVPASQFPEQIYFVSYNRYDPPGSAVMRSVAVAWILKYYILQDWAIYAERLGDPPMIAEYAPGSIVVPAGSDKTVSEYITELLEQMKSHAIGAIPEGLTVRLLADDRFDGSRAFDMLIDRLDRSIKRAILSSEATIQTGIYGQGGKAADSIRATYGLDTVIQADAEAIRLMLQRILHDASVRLGAERERLRVKIDWIEELPTFRLIQAISLLARAGVQFDTDEALLRAGFRPKTGGQDNGDQ